VRWTEVSGTTNIESPSLTFCSLGYAELYLALAAIVRRFNLSLYETDYSDIEAVCDCVMPMPKADTKGVRVMVS
jgi:hypothetical protein